MRVQQPVRDPNLSLWQPAVRRTLVNRGDLSDEARNQIEHGVSMHAQSEQDDKPLPQALPQPQDAGKASLGPGANIAQASKTIFDSIRAHQDNDSAGHDSLFAKLEDLVTKYSSWDLAGWAQCGWYYTKYYVLAHLTASYRNWRGLVSADDLAYGMIKYRLPAKCDILMIGDWGTHMPDNVALLRQAIKTFKPQAIIHLGDVYYSGTVEECTENVLDVMDQIYSDKTLGSRPPFFTIPGNHDYYSGGAGFFHTIDTINSGIADCTQQASYFCLRTEDDKWQFLGMDTGFNDRSPGNQLLDPEGPDLHRDEIEWHKDKLHKFGGSTILLSHHQLISAKEQLSRSGRHYLNSKLFDKFAPYLDRVSAWFWGHEHCLIFFEDNLTIDAKKAPLKKGRLLGCSAYEEAVDEEPFKQKYAQARFIPDMPQLKLSPYKTGAQKFYNHAFAILKVAPDKIEASYFEYPSWGEGQGPASEPPVGPPLYKEDLLPR
jgi:3',5'-cyclic AMP phosphodiesterase CpdA